MDVTRILKQEYQGLSINFKQRCSGRNLNEKSERKAQLNLDIPILGWVIYQKQEGISVQCQADNPCFTVNDFEHVWEGMMWSLYSEAQSGLWGLV